MPTSALVPTQSSIPARSSRAERRSVRSASSGPTRASSSRASGVAWSSKAGTTSRARASEITPSWSPMFAADSIELPAWARVNDKRRAHIARVTALLDRWAAELRIPPDEARAWRDAGLLHDALRDAPEHELRGLITDPSLPVQILHGPAPPNRPPPTGEPRSDVPGPFPGIPSETGPWHAPGADPYMPDSPKPGEPFGGA